MSRSLQAQPMARAQGAQRDALRRRRLARRLALIIALGLAAGLVTGAAGFSPASLWAELHGSNAALRQQRLQRALVEPYDG